jgi:hypothetical protein
MARFKRWLRVLNKSRGDAAWQEVLRRYEEISLEM